MLKKQIINSVASCCLITTMALTGCKSTEVEKVPTSSLAKEAFNDKNWEDAVKEYSLAIKEEGPKYEFFLNRGISYNNLKEHNAAITDFYNAHKLRPDDEGVSLYKAAEIFFKLKSYDKAVYLCKQIGQDNPNAIQLEIKSYQNLLIQAKQRKDFQKVKEISLALLKLQPHNYEFKLDILRAKVYSKQNKIDREDLEKEIIKLLAERTTKNINEQLIYLRTLNLYKIATPESLRKAYI
jgi:tetratricopeptide (TPR) repeat protein